MTKTQGLPIKLLLRYKKKSDIVGWLVWWISKGYAVYNILNLFIFCDNPKLFLFKLGKYKNTLPAWVISGQCKTTHFSFLVSENLLWKQSISHPLHFTSIYPAFIPAFSLKPLLS